MARVINASIALLVMFVLLAGCQALTGETVGQNIDDTNLTAYVKAKLVGDKAVNLTRIGVTTTNGVVHLTGVVRSDREREHAEELAREVQGVKGVVNNIQVRTQ
jgi:osmotically-inducible protein OsmY